MLPTIMKTPKHALWFEGFQDEAVVQRRNLRVKEKEPPPLEGRDPAFQTALVCN